MIIYVDILIFLNTVITYLILVATQWLARVRTGVWRLIIASVIGGLSSIYILLPQQNFVIESIVKLVFSAAIILTALKTANVKVFLRTVLIFYAVSFLYAGVMLGVWYAIKPENLIINNGVVYFSVSPVLLIVSSGLCYVLIRVIQTILKPSDKYSRRVSVLFINGLHKVSCNCIVDTGCSVGDAFGDFRVAIVGFNVAKELFGEKETLSLIKLAPDDNISKKFRLIPYNTLNSSGVLPAVRVEGAFVFGKELKNVLVCVSDKNFCDDFEGIISPLFFDEGDACV